MAKAVDFQIEVEGLRETIKALNRVDKKLGQAAVQAMRDEAKMVKVKAQTRLRNRGGAAATYPRSRGMIRSGATQGGGTVSLETGRYPWSPGAEFGGHTHTTFGRRMPQGSLRRRTLGRWRGNQFVVVGVGGPGYLIQPTIRRELKGIEDRISKEISLLYDTALNQAGVPRAAA